MKGPHFVAAPAGNASSQPPEAEVVIEVLRGGFLKRGSSGSVDFVSPFADVSRGLLDHVARLAASSCGMGCHERAGKGNIPVASSF